MSSWARGTGPFKDGECTLPATLHAAFENGAWLILDIKTDFRARSTWQIDAGNRPIVLDNPYIS